LARARRGHVQLPGAVAALAADTVPVEHGLRVAVYRALDVVGPVGVTEKTVGQDGPAAEKGRNETGRQVPLLFLRVPADRRLEQVTVQVGDVGVTPLAGADGVVHLKHLFRDRAAGRVEASSTVPHPLPLALDQELKTKGLEGMAPWRLLRRGHPRGDGPQG